MSMYDGENAMWFRSVPTDHGHEDELTEQEYIQDVPDVVRDILARECFNSPAIEAHNFTAVKEYLRDHLTHDGRFSVGVKLYDLDLSDEDQDRASMILFYDTGTYGYLAPMFWSDAEYLLRLYRQIDVNLSFGGRSSGHLELIGVPSPDARWDGTGTVIDFTETVEELYEIACAVKLLDGCAGQLRAHLIEYIGLIKS